MTTTHHLEADTARTLLTLRDLTDPTQGPHAMQRSVEAAVSALTDRWRLPVHLHRPNPVVPVADNYDRLGYPRDAVARDARYSRYLSDTMMLRAHTSAAMPDLHARVAAGALHAGERDLVVAVAGLTYRRDAVDRLHVGEPHQLDTWRLRLDDPPLGEADLDELVDVLTGALLPARRWRTSPREHPYTERGRQVDVRGDDGSWVEIAECGLTAPGLLREAGLPPAASGLALGLGLDRVLMLRKGIEDIRMLRATDPRIARQLLDLTPYRPVSVMPAMVRDVSIAADEDLDDEQLGDRVREALGPDASAVEHVEVRSSTPVAALPDRAVQRLGADRGQHNLLVRIVLRDLDRTLTAEEGNRLRDRIYAALHAGTVHTWASGGPTADPGTSGAPHRNARSHPSHHRGR